MIRLGKLTDDTGQGLLIFGSTFSLIDAGKREKKMKTCTRSNQDDE